MEHVTVNLGYTMNLGNFESLRFDYGVTSDVRSGESLDDAIKRVETLVEDKLVTRLREEKEHDGK